MYTPKGKVNDSLMQHLGSSPTRAPMGWHGVWELLPLESQRSKCEAADGRGVEGC